jgi:large subunit ribosomal protein L22
LSIAQAWVGKGFYGRPQIDIKGRGHFGIKRHPYSHMKFLFKEKASEQVPTITGMKERRDIKGFKLTRKVWMPVRDTKPIYNYKNYYNW